MKSVHRLIALGLCVAVIAADAQAYEISTHQDMTEAALQGDNKLHAIRVNGYRIGQGRDNTASVYSLVIGFQ